MINTILLLVSIASGLICTSSQNKFSKDNCKSFSDTLFFTLTNASICLAASMIFGKFWEMSTEVFILGCAFGLTQIVSNLLNVRAFKYGSMSLTILTMFGGSMLISSIGGSIIWHESISLIRIIGIILLLISMGLILNPKLDKRISVKWIVMTLGAATASGLLGISQKAVSALGYEHQKPAFLFVGFVFGVIADVIYYYIYSRRHNEKTSIRFDGRSGILTLIAGVTLASQHIINLILVGRLPAAMFFPLCNGSRIVLTGVVGALVFKEKMTRYQFAGFILGFSALMLCAGVLG